jgi:Cyanobacterial TRADD-N associated 2-Transmembrane domain
VEKRGILIVNEDTQNEDKINQEIEELQELLSLSQKNENDKPQSDPGWNVGSVAIGTDSTIPIQATYFVSDYAMRQQAVQDVAKANPNNIQEVAASQLSIINSYYQSGLQQSQQSFRWSLIWGGIGLIFLIAAVSFLLIREPTEVALASGIGGAIVEVFAATYLYLYKHASDQLAGFRASLESTQRLLLGNSMCEKLEGEIEQTTRSELIRLMVQSAVHISTKESQKAP